MWFIKSWVAFNNLSLDLKPTFPGTFFFACGLMSHKVQEPFLVLFSRRCFDAGPSTLRLLVWGPLVSNEGAVCRGPSLVVWGVYFCCLLRDCDQIAEMGFILLKQRIDWTMEGLFFGGCFCGFGCLWTVTYFLVHNSNMDDFQGYVIYYLPRWFIWLVFT